MGDWLRDKISALLATAALHPGCAVAVPGAGTVALGGAVEKWGDSTADVLMARGKIKHVYDAKFSVPLPLAAEAAGGKEGQRALLVFTDVSNDTADAPREVALEFSEGVGEATRAALKDALRADGSGAAGAIVKAAREAVEKGVAQFLAL
jgi:hypothetical protein